MIRIYKAAEINDKWLRDRGEQSVDLKVEQAVAQIIAHVRKEGDKALLDYCRQFDKVELESLKVSEYEIAAAWNEVDEGFRSILQEAAENIRKYHRAQLRDNVLLNGDDGIVLGQRFTPIEKVGIYVPGGTAAYPSSVLMNAIPAVLAGCRSIVMVTPPGPDGSVSADILAAATIAGVTDIYKVGGAQAIAALAYGTESIPRVSKIVGPGNIYVATAKKQVYGVCAIDMIAGPSEILIIADKGAKSSWLAADMLSQAEHDKLSSAILICFSQEQAESVRSELCRQLALLSRADIAAASINNQGAIIVAESMEEALDLADSFAPEHLELAVENPFDILDKVNNAGSIFLGYHTPEPLGDYWAGPNHVLPTMGLAACCSPLSVDDFRKRSSYLYYTPEALEKCSPKVRCFALREGLSAHAASIAVREEES